MIFCFFQAVDLDSVASIEYILTGNYNPFEIDKDSGFVYVNQPLDYEKQTAYKFSVTTKDGQGSNLPLTSAQVIINVLVSDIFLDLK